MPLVYGDHEQGGYLATKHLIDLGHRRIAFCSFADFQVTLRWQGHRRALREAAKRGLEIKDCFLDIEEMLKPEAKASATAFHIAIYGV